MRRSLFTAGACFVAYAAAQTYSSCNPLNTTNCVDDPALGTTLSTTFNDSMTEFDGSLFNVTAGASLVSFGKDGAELQIVKQGDSVTVQTAFYIFWGQVEIIFKAAAGTGIISTAILLSDDLDEVDWEIKGSNSSFVSNNYYGHGNTTQYNSQYPPLKGAQDDFHNYTVDWNKDRVEYILDNNVVRTVPYAASGLYPQTPSFVRFGIWAAGDPSLPKGTIEWAGGETDYSKG